MQADFFLSAQMLAFTKSKDTLAFLHIPKSGGTTFEKRLTMLNVDPPCAPTPTRSADTFHNGHPLVNPRSCFCPRAAKGRDQWLVTPVTSGWRGGVHAPLVFFKKNIPIQTEGQVYVATMLRDPIPRTISEFYESFDGWEFGFDTPYQEPRIVPGACVRSLTATQWCSRVVRAPETFLRRCSLAMNLSTAPNIDRMRKSLYDRRALRAFVSRPPHAHTHTYAHPMPRAVFSQGG